MAIKLESRKDATEPMLQTVDNRYQAKDQPKKVKKIKEIDMMISKKSFRLSCYKYKGNNVWKWYVLMLEFGLKSNEILGKRGIIDEMERRNKKKGNWRGLYNCARLDK